MKNINLLEKVIGYIPYDLKCYDSVSKSIVTVDPYKYTPACIKETLGFKTEDFPNGRISIMELVEDTSFKPLLKPLSKVTEKCLSGGRIPIVEILKFVTNDDVIVYEITEEKHTSIVRFNRFNMVSEQYCQRFLEIDLDRFNIDYGMEYHLLKDGVFSDTEEFYPLPIDYISVLKMMYEWFFDIHNLINDNLAIDVDQQKSLVIEHTW